MTVFDWLLRLIPGGGAILDGVANFLGNAIDGVATMLSGLASAPAALLGFLNAPQFQNTVMADGFGIVVFVGLGALAFRLIINLF